MKTTDRWAALYMLVILILGALFAQGLVLKRLDSRRSGMKSESRARGGAGVSDAASTPTLQAPAVTPTPAIPAPVSAAVSAPPPAASGLPTAVPAPSVRTTPFSGK